MKILLLLCALLGIYGSAYAQAPKPVDKPAPLPAAVEITAKADVELITKARMELELAQLRASNLRYELEKALEQARKQLAALEKAEADERSQWQTMISAMSKIPTEHLNEYQLTEKDGKFTLTRKIPNP